MSKFTEFVKKHTGTFVEVSDPNNYAQCMDLAYAFVDDLGVPRITIKHLYAYQVYTEPNDETLKWFELVPNTINGVPKEGNLVVFSKELGSAGHICIATGKGDTNGFESFDQNYGNPKSCRIVTHNYTGCLGWLKVRQENQTPVWLINFMSEKGIPEDQWEGNIRAWFDGSKTSEELQKQVNKLQRDIAEAVGDASKYEASYLSCSKESKKCQDALEKARRDVSDRDSQITELSAKLKSLESIPVKTKNWFCFWRR